MMNEWMLTRCLVCFSFFFFSVRLLVLSASPSPCPVPVPVPSSSSELLLPATGAGLLVVRLGGWRLIPASAVQSEYSLEESL